MALLALLACLAGIAACCAFRRQAPRPLSIAAVSLAVWAAVSLLEWMAEPVIYHLFGPRFQGGFLVSNAMSIVQFLSGIGRAAAILGLTWAVLVDRKLDFQKPRL